MQSPYIPSRKTGVWPLHDGNKDEDAVLLEVREVREPASRAGVRCVRWREVRHWRGLAWEARGGVRW